eukprot:3042120-Rhodomonas_salina.3
MLLRRPPSRRPPPAPQDSPLSLTDSEEEPAEVGAHVTEPEAGAEGGRGGVTPRLPALPSASS